jgi:hypothetical protein
LRFTVTVNDITPPVITLAATRLFVAPDQYPTVNVSDLVASASDLCDSSVNLNSVVIASAA